MNIADSSETHFPRSALFTATPTPHLASQIERHEAIIASRNLIAHYHSISFHTQRYDSPALTLIQAARSRVHVPTANIHVLVEESHTTLRTPERNATTIIADVERCGVWEAFDGAWVFH
jgi:hypothetical protein